MPKSIVTVKHGFVKFITPEHRKKGKARIFSNDAPFKLETDDRHVQIISIKILQSNLNPLEQSHGNAR